MRDSMKDFLGRETRAGDFIFYSTTGRYAESRFCRVARFTEKTMFVDVLDQNRPSYSKNENVPVRNDFVRVDLTEEDIRKAEAWRNMSQSVSK